MGIRRMVRDARLKIKKQSVPSDLCPECKFCVDSRCRRWPPVVYSPIKEAVWPTITAEMWCGEFVSKV